MRIAILDNNNCPVGYIDARAPDALHIYDDKMHTYLQGTAATFEFKVSAQHETALLLECGNKLSFQYNGKDYYFNIVSVNEDEYEREVSCTSLCFELLNEGNDKYSAGTAMSFAEYFNLFVVEKGICTIGINEVSEKRIKHEWEGESKSILERLYSLATVFDAEIEFVPELNHDYSLNHIVCNVYRKHSDKDQGIGTNRLNDFTLRYGREIDGITRKVSIDDIYTCIRPIGKDGLNIIGMEEQKIYDSDGVLEFWKPAGSGEIYAVQARDLFPSNVLEKNGRYILYRWETQYETIADLYGNALSKLKEISQPKVTYEVDGSVDAGIGDTVRIVDEGFKKPLYLTARVTEQEISFTDPSQNKTTFDNAVVLAAAIDNSLQSQVDDLKKAAVEARAAAEEAKSTATAAQETASTAQSTADNAHTLAQTAKDTADTASETATTASNKADAAQTTASDANATANTANTTADTAQETATKASTTATEAKATAEAAQTAITATQNYFFHDADGAHVTTTESDASTGKNVLIDSDSVKIRDGNTTLSVFDKGSVKLGLGGNDLYTEINFGNGAAKLIGRGTEQGEDTNEAVLSSSKITISGGLEAAIKGFVAELLAQNNGETKASITLTASDGKVSITGTKLDFNGKTILDESYKPAIVEEKSIKGMGYSFLWVEDKPGYFLAAAYCIRSDDQYRVTGMNWNHSSNLYTVLIGQNVSNTTTLNFRLLWVKI